MPRFGIGVKLFALNERAQSKGWKQIKEGIRQKYNIEPPTTRALQKWVLNLDRDALNAELMKEIKANMPMIQAKAQESMATALLPTLLRAKEAGEDYELAGWKWFLNFIDTRLGNKRFERLINQYMTERKVRENTTLENRGT